MALSGLMYITGDPDKEPLCTGGEPADYFGALHAWIGVLAALEHRAQSGAGQHVDVSLLESLGSADEYNTTMYSYLGAIRKRLLLAPPHPDVPERDLPLPRRTHRRHRRRDRVPADDGDPDRTAGT